MNDIPNHIKDFTFSDIIENHHASPTSGRRFGYFVMRKEKGLGNSRESVVVLTDGNETFWELIIGGSRLSKIQTVRLPLLHDPSSAENWRA